MIGVKAVRPVNDHSYSSLFVPDRSICHKFYRTNTVHVANWPMFFFGKEADPSDVFRFVATAIGADRGIALLLVKGRDARPSPFVLNNTFYPNEILDRFWSGLPIGITIPLTRTPDDTYVARELAVIEELWRGESVTALIEAVRQALATTVERRDIENTHALRHVQV